MTLVCNPSLPQKGRHTDWQDGRRSHEGERDGQDRPRQKKTAEMVGDTTLAVALSSNDAGLRQRSSDSCGTRVLFHGSNSLTKEKGIVFRAMAAAGREAVHIEFFSCQQ
jgi:hypothetical protein